MKTNLKNDYELIYSVREVGVEQKESIFEKYIPIIKSIAYQKYRKLNAIGADLDDLVQEGFIGLDRAIDNYDVQSNALFYTYACICIERQISNYTRKFYRMKEVKDYKYYEEADSFQMVSETSTDYVMSDYYYQRLIRIKNSFSFMRSCVFELRYNGFSYKEIAVLLDINQKEVDAHLYKLRKLLKKEGIKEIFA